MSERDRARSKDYFFRPIGGEVENRIDEPAHITEARDIISPPVMPPTWHLMPQKITPLSRLGYLLGGADIAKPSPEEIAQYRALIDAASQSPSFNERWPDPLQTMGMRPMSPSIERGFASR